MGAIKNFLINISEDVVERFGKPLSYVIGAQFIVFKYQRDTQRAEYKSILISDILWGAFDEESAVEFILKKLKF